MKLAIADTPKNLSSSQCDRHVKSAITQGNLPEVNRNRVSPLMLADLRVGIVVSNSDGTITLANAAAKRLAQMNPEGKSLSVAPRIWGELFDPSGRRVPVHRWPCMRALQGKTTVDLECRLVRSDRSGSSILFGSCPIRKAGSQMCGSLSSLTDVTDVKQKEVSLREGAIVRERARFATDIHDTLLQGLSAVVLQFEALEPELPQELALKLARIKQIARETLAETRRSIWVLSHEPADEQDPAATLGFIAEKLFSGMPISLQFRLQECPGLDSRLRFALTRIGKEALTNVLKHSRATVVRIELTYARKEVRLSVIDNGCGFAASTAQAQDGFGLFGLKARAQLLGGDALVHSRAGSGTSVVVTLPVRRECGVDRSIQ